jgi:hypothetical protein
MILAAIILLNDMSYMKVSLAQMGHGHNLPSANLGDRQQTAVTDIYNRTITIDIWQECWL